MRPGIAPMSILHDAWRLARPYFRSAEGRRAWLLLGIVLALNLALTGLDVVLNYWNGAFWTALQQRDATGFFRLLFLWNGAMPGWLLLTLPYVALTVLDAWLVQRMQIDWRRRMTGEFLGRFLADRAYYQLGLTRDPTSDAGADNPDQRIAEDVASFCTATLSLGVDLFSSAISLASFVAVLWRLSSGLQFFGVAIPGSMVWIALLFATCGSALAHIVGRPLIALDFARERAEANFRFGLMRLRENAAAVALLRGEPAERTRLDVRFGAIMANWLALIRRRAMLSGTLLVFTQAEGIVPSVIAAPAWFAGRIAFGTLTRIAGAFAQVSSALSWFINAYPSLAAWAATVRRLSSFERAMAAARATTGIQHVPGTSVATENLRLTLPDGTALLSLENLHFPPASATLLHGPNGAGKSTLLRAIAGVWPFGTGTVTLPPGRMMFLPQQPYLPQGSLRAALCYPYAACTDDDLANALTAVGLGNLIARLDDIQDWGHILSGGEQQRLCLAGALAQRPDILFLDEATASLDPMDEAAIYRHLRASLPHTTIISIGHRAQLAALHDRVLPIDGQASVWRRKEVQGSALDPLGPEAPDPHP